MSKRDATGEFGMAEVRVKIGGIDCGWTEGVVIEVVSDAHFGEASEYPAECYTRTIVSRWWRCGPVEVLQGETYTNGIQDGYSLRRDVSPCEATTAPEVMEADPW